MFLVTAGDIIFNGHGLRVILPARVPQKNKSMKKVKDFEYVKNK